MVYFSGFSVKIEERRTDYKTHHLQPSSNWKIWRLRRNAFWYDVFPYSICWLVVELFNGASLVIIVRSCDWSSILTRTGLQSTRSLFVNAFKANPFKFPKVYESRISCDLALCRHFPVYVVGWHSSTRQNEMKRVLSLRHTLHLYNYLHRFCLPYQPSPCDTEPQHTC